MTERERFNFLSDDCAVRYMNKFHTGARVADFLRKASLIQPTLLCPKEHPTTLAVNDIFERLVATAATDFAIDSECWTVDIISYPGQ